VAVIGLLTRLAPSTVFPFLSIFIVDVLGGTALDAGLVIGVLGVTSILSQLSSGIVGDRFGKWRMLGIGAVLSGVTAPLLLFATDLLGVYILLPAASVAIYLSQPMLSALVGDIAQEHERGRAYGAYGVVRDTAFIIGPLIGGGMIELFSLFTGIGFDVTIYYLFGMRVLILVGAAVVAVLSLPLILGVDTVYKDQPTSLEEHVA
jgi:MFS family permease